jgi:hypothetical protein
MMYRKIKNIDLYIPLNNFHSKKVTPPLKVWEQVTSLEKRWLNGSAPDCKSVVLGSNPAPPQHTVNSVSPEVGSHLG